MKTSFGGTWLIQLMILFILLFAGYIILTIEYSKNVRVKNEMISIVEKYDGLNEQSITLLNNYMSSVGYRVQNGCEVGEGIYGLTDLQNNELEETQEGEKYYYCVKKYKGASTSYYYQITVFYRFNLPVLGDISGFTIKGTTTNFQSQDDNKYCMTISGSCREITTNRPNGSNNNGNNSNVVYYNVSFDLNGGTGSIPTQKVRAGRRADQPADPTKDDFTFGGWTLNGSSFDFYTFINSDITLVAKWETPTIIIPTFRDYVINKATDRWSGYYDCISHSTYCEKTVLPSIRMFACTDYTTEYPSVFATIDDCHNEMNRIYDGLPQRVNK